MKTFKTWVILVILFSASNLFSQTRYYVNVNSPCISPSCTPNGLSWSSAFEDLQTALGAALHGDEIWVAKGTYYPTAGSNQSSHFNITKDIDIYGHFDGSESTLNQRNLHDVLWASSNRTILSGNLGNQNSLSDNSNSVVKYTFNGGFSNATISLNDLSIADARWTGVWSSQSTSSVNSNYLYFNHVMFHNNGTNFHGGGMHAGSGSHTRIDRCKFLSNTGQHGGAFMRFGVGSLDVYNSIFESNITTHNGAIACGGNSYPYTMKIQNCSFKGNKSLQGEISCVTNWYFMPIEISNSIFWGNSGTAILNDNGISVLYSIVENGYAGANQQSVVNQDPIWIDSDLNLGITSPAANTGNNSLYIPTSMIDINGDPRIYAYDIDRGAQESEHVTFEELPYRKKFNDSESNEFILQIFPNPASDKIQLNGFEGQINVTLLDINGKIAFQSIAVNNSQIDISSLSSGIYVIQALDAFNNKIHKKLIIE